MKKIVTLLFFAILCTYSVYGKLEQYSNNQNDVEYRFGSYRFSKIKYIYNLGTNVQNYLDYKLRYESWTSDFVLEFQNAYNRYMKAFKDPNNPHRFYTDDFGTLIDTKGEFNSNDVDDYWYDNKGNKITGYEYRNLKDSKKKKYRTFQANREVATYFNKVGKAIAKDSNKPQKKSTPHNNNNNNQEFVGW